MFYYMEMYVLCWYYLLHAGSMLHGLISLGYSVCRRWPSPRVLCHRESTDV